MAVTGNYERSTSYATWATAFIATLALTLAVMGFLFKDWRDFKRFAIAASHHYEVSLDIQKDVIRAHVGKKLSLKGRAEIPKDGSLYLFVHPPDVRKYYVAPDNGLLVKDGTWSTKVQMGRKDPEGMREDLKYPDWTIYLLILDRQTADSLAIPTEPDGAAYTRSLPDALGRLDQSVKLVE